MRDIRVATGSHCSALHQRVSARLIANGRVITLDHAVTFGAAEHRGYERRHAILVPASFLSRLFQLSVTARDVCVVEWQQVAGDDSLNSGSSDVSGGFLLLQATDLCGCTIRFRQ